MSNWWTGYLSDTSDTFFRCCLSNSHPFCLLNVYCPVWLSVSQLLQTIFLRFIDFFPRSPLCSTIFRSFVAFRFNFIQFSCNSPRFFSSTLKNARKSFKNIYSMIWFYFVIFSPLRLTFSFSPFWLYKKLYLSWPNLVLH